MYPSSDQNLNYETDDTVYWFSTAFEPLNNWSAHAVKLWGLHFPTVEHAYHYKKFSGDNPAVAEQILTAPSPWASMQLARKHKELVRADWHAIKAASMLEIVRAKVNQNVDVQERLRATGKKRIVENSPWDSFWGCGPDGKGENQMGKILMQIRDELKASTS